MDWKELQTRNVNGKTEILTQYIIIIIKIIKNHNETLYLLIWQKWSYVGKMETFSSETKSISNWYHCSKCNGIVCSTHKCKKIVEVINPFMHAIIVDQQCKQTPIRALIPCLINGLFPHMLNTLSNLSHKKI